MSSVHESNISGIIVQPLSVNWRTPEKTYRIHIVTITEEDGTYSTIALNLPGAGSCGDTPDRSVENAKEAIAGVLESYLESGVEIPWIESRGDQTPGVHKWISLHV